MTERVLIPMSTLPKVDAVYPIMWTGSAYAYSRYADGRWYAWNGNAAVAMAERRDVTRYALGVLPGTEWLGWYDEPQFAAAPAPPPAAPLNGQWVPVGEVQALPDGGQWRIVVRSGHLVPADAPASTLDPNAGMIENDLLALARKALSPNPAPVPKPAPRVLHWTERSPDLRATSHQVSPSHVLAASRFGA